MGCGSSFVFNWLDVYVPFSSYIFTLYDTTYYKTRVQHFSDAKASAYVLSGPDTWYAVFETPGTSERVGDWG